MFPDLKSRFAIFTFSNQVVILLLDNYDSFTYNLYHAAEKIQDEVIVVARNDEITLDEIEKYSSVILSPGPGLPSEAGIMPALLERYVKTKPILGICLGHQAIGAAFGGSLIHSGTVYHGVEKDVKVISTDDDEIFRDVPNVFPAGRYHSWLLNRDTLPLELQITAVDEDGNIMSIRHNHFPVKGIQFHPESIMTPVGEKLLINWFKFADKFRQA